MLALSLRAMVLGALVVSLVVLATPQRSFASTTASDNFNRANGSLGANWTDMTVGGMAISNDAVVGTQAAGNSGDIYTGTTFGSDQSSQIQVTSTPLGGGQWIGPTVRAQNGGQSLYLGIYWGSNGNPELEMFKLVNGGWTQLGSAFASGTLAAGTELTLSVTGSTLSFSENGVVEITATDTSLTGGGTAPGDSYPWPLSTGAQPPTVCRRLGVWSPTSPTVTAPQRAWAPIRSGAPSRVSRGRSASRTTAGTL